MNLSPCSCSPPTKEKIVKVDHSTYCAKVCGAKCCYLYLPHPIACPCLALDATCAIYDHRFQEGAPALMAVGHYRFGGKIRPFVCGKIADIIREGWLPKDIEVQCCYAHPELLEDTKTGTEISFRRNTLP